MRKGGQASISKYEEDRTGFIKTTVQEGRPPNMIIVLDTHSDTFTGQLQATGGLTTSGTTLTLPSLVTGYVGNSVW